jgi:hypothetical protein
MRLRTPAHPRFRLRIRDSKADYLLKKGGGVHIKCYLEVMNQIVQERFDVPDFVRNMDTIDTSTFARESPFIHEVCVGFTNENYLSWKAECVKKPDYDAIDRAVHVDFCTSCLIREVCASDCDRVDERRYELFFKDVTVDTSGLKGMFEKFLEKRCGRRLPELHCKYEPPRPSKSVEIDEEGDTTITSDAASEEGADSVEDALVPEDDLFGL